MDCTQEMHHDARCQISQEQRHAVRALNDLIVATLDNAAEYRRAAFAVEHQLADLRHRAYESTRAVERLQREVRALGGEPANACSTLGAAVATLLSNTRLLIKGKDDLNNFLQDAERGDRQLQKHFTRYLADRALPPAAHGAIADAQYFLTLQNDQLRQSPEQAWVPMLQNGSLPAALAEATCS
jgi:uncharacterized protein (TIGR02284 family)